MRRMIAALMILAVGGLAPPATAQQLGPQPAPGPPVFLSRLLAGDFEIKGAVLAGILVQNGPLAYICTTAQRERPVEWTCLPLHR